MKEALVPLRQRSTRSGTAAACLGDSHVSVAHGPDSDTPVRHRQIHFSAICLDWRFILPCYKHSTFNKNPTHQVRSQCFVLITAKQKCSNKTNIKSKEVARYY